MGYRVHSGAGGSKPDSEGRENRRRNKTCRVDRNLEGVRKVWRRHTFVYASLTAVLKVRRSPQLNTFLFPLLL